MIEAWTKKIYWRCHVCNDIHYGVHAPDICPTCGSKKAYVEIDANEAKLVMRL